MMKIVFNGASQTIDNNMCLSQFISLHVDSSRPYAVAVNGQFIPKSRYAETRLNDGDELEAVSPVGGG